MKEWQISVKNLLEKNFIINQKNVYMMYLKMEKLDQINYLH